MTFDEAFIWGFFLVFARSGAMFLTTPFFNAQATPVSVRVMAALAVSASLTVALRPAGVPIPADLYGMAAAVLVEVVAGVMLGMFVSLAMAALQMAGAFLDLQIGLGMSQVINPATGVPVTLLSQFKYLLGLVVLLASDGHHVLLRAFAASLSTTPGGSGLSLADATDSFVAMIGEMSLLAVQIAAPVLAIMIVVDAAFGLVNKAVPQMPVMLVGMPAKISLGLIAVSVTLPVVVSGVGSGLDVAFRHLSELFRVQG